MQTKQVRVTRISTKATRIMELSCEDMARMLFRCEGLILEVLG
jgi:hypothetical protein